MTGPAPRPGVRILGGRYRLERILGRGAMGTVWAAFDQMLHRRVAIKEINFPPGLPAAEQRMLTERTLREARAIAKLSHPHVITVYDILIADGAPVIVMEMLAARSLADILAERGTLAAGQVATIGAAVAAALAAAHAAGITHRDVKPGNVLIAADGRIKLTDFGVARSQSESSMTATGLLLGSPSYIAPEVATGQIAGPAADAWGLGALLFACTEGRPPYDRGTPLSTLMAVVADPVPAPLRAGPLTPVLNALLVKSPAHRMTVARAREALLPLADDPLEGRLRQELRPAVHLPSASAAAPVTGAARPTAVPGAEELPPPPWAAGGSPARDSGSDALPPPPWAAAGSPPGAGAAPLPPPPWAGAGDLPPLPPAAPRPTVAGVGPRVWAVAVVLAVLAAVLGHLGVTLIVDLARG